MTSVHCTPEYIKHFGFPLSVQYIQYSPINACSGLKQHDNFDEIFHPKAYLEKILYFIQNITRDSQSKYVAQSFIIFK